MTSSPLVNPNAKLRNPSFTKPLRATDTLDVSNLRIKELREEGGYLGIDQYGLIGNLHTSALVSIDSSIDSMCWPNFDSPSIFARLLDWQKGGHFQICPNWDCTQRALYLPNTAILQTKFLHEDGVATVTDWMPRPRPSVEAKPLFPCVVRRIEVVRGTVPFRMECYPAFNYCQDSHQTALVQDDLIDGGKDHKKVAFKSKDLELELRWFVESGDTDKPPKFDITIDKESDKKGLLGPGVYADFTLEESQVITFILWEPISEKDGSVPAAKPSINDAKHAEAAIKQPGSFIFRDPVKLTAKFCLSLLNDTKIYWKHWVSKSTYKGQWREFVMRSAITLKLLVFEPTGAIVAAPTFSLPEDLHGAGRNWDYRFSWIRDASFTVYAFIRLGFTAEANAYMNFMQQRIIERDRNSDNPLQIVFTINGGKDLVELELPHLDGYKGQKPVRIGNGAADHLQLDTFGELLDAIYLHQKFATPLSFDLWVQVRELVDFVCDNWKRADMSIWEVRSQQQDFVYSKVMCWVAVDRGLRLAEKRSLPLGNQRRSKWMETRDEIYEEVQTRGFNKQKNFFAQSYQAMEVLDSSVLIMPLCFFMPASDPRFLSTLNQILKPPEKGGLVANNLTFRYDFNKSEDGVGGSEGAFLMVSMWLVEALTRAGTWDSKYLDKAVEVFEDLVAYGNHVGLFSEEISRSGEALGNMPQAFTHVSTISAAFNLDRVLSGRKGDLNQ